MNPDRNLTCPSCNRFTGPALQCPYCGADTHHRHRLLRLRWAAIMLAAMGFGVLILS